MFTKLLKSVYGLFRTDSLNDETSNDSSSDDIDNKPSAIDVQLANLEYIKQQLKIRKSKLNKELTLRRKNRHDVAYHIYCIHRNKQDKTPLKELHNLRNDLDNEIKSIENRLSLITIQLNAIECKITEFHTCMTIALTKMVNDMNFDNMLILNGQAQFRHIISCQPVASMQVLC